MTPTGRTNVEDVYTLTPVQLGILFEVLAEPAPGMYLDQMTCEVRGPLDEAAFSRAWQAAVDRHPTLRTGFVWTGVSKPVQIVHRRVPFAVTWLAWRGLDEAECERRFTELSVAERRRGVTLETPPLMRVVGVRMGDERYRFVWSIHHLIEDAWSISVLMKEVLAAYHARADRIAGPPPRPYRDFVAWLKRQDLGATEAFWREYLRGWHQVTPIPFGRHRPEAPSEERMYRMSLGADISRRLAAAAKRLRITEHILLQTAWALLLARETGERDIVFGTVVAGRPIELAGIDATVGPFINTLPTRVRLHPGEPLADLARRLHADQRWRHRVEHTPLGRIAPWIGHRQGTRLFETALIALSARLSATRGDAGALVFDRVKSSGRASFPLAMRTRPGNETVIEVLYDPRRIGTEDAPRVAHCFSALLDTLPDALDAPVERLLDRSAPRASMPRPAPFARRSGPARADVQQPPVAQPAAPPAAPRPDVEGHSPRVIATPTPGEGRFGEGRS